MRRNPHNTIQDLDRELELLRRKRELLEVQQNMLNRSDNQNHAVSPWDEPPRNFSFSSFNNYTELYDSAQPQRDSGPRFRGNNSGSFRGNNNNSGTFGGNNNNSGTFRGNNRKRPTNEQWDRPPAKRADRPPPRGGPPKFAGGSNDNRRPPPQDDRPPRTRPGARSTPNKVTKPKDSHPPPQKLNTYPEAQRKELVGKTLDTFKEVLRPDQEPSKQLTGRLELALGEILKDMRKKYSSMSDALAVHVNSKTVKQAIRDRIRTVMLGKPVNVFHTVVTEYRKVFPNDDEIVKLVTKLDTPRGRQSRDSTGGKSKPICQANETNTSDQAKPTSAVASNTTEPKLRDEVSEYFKNNTRRLVSEQVDGMLSSLEKLYAQDDSQYKNEVTNIVKEIHGLQKQKEALLDKEQKIDNDDVNTDVQISQDDAKEGKEVDVKEVEVKEEPEGKEEPVEADKNAADGVTKEEPAAIAEEKINNEETSKKDTSVEEAMEEGVSKTDGNVKTEEEIVQKLVFNYEAFMNRYIRKALPGLLYNHRNLLVKVITSDGSYRAVQKKIKDGDCVVDDQGKVNEKGSAQSTPKPRVNYKDIPYFVKICGRPKLPPREKMTKFLQQFNTLTIKKPRSIHNVLIIGLSTKTDFDNILAANKTKFGNIEIKVTPSEFRKKDDVETKPKEEDDGPLILPDADLDAQIDDLLNSIKTDVGGIDEDEKAPEITSSEEAQKTDVEKDLLNEEYFIGDSTTKEVEENIPDTNGDSKQEDAASDDVQIIEDDSTPVDNVVNEEATNSQGEDAVKDSKAEGDTVTAEKPVVNETKARNAEKAKEPPATARTTRSAAKASNV